MKMVNLEDLSKQELYEVAVKYRSRCKRLHAEVQTLKCGVNEDLTTTAKTLLAEIVNTGVLINTRILLHQRAREVLDKLENAE